MSLRARIRAWRALERRRREREERRDPCSAVTPNRRFYLSNWTADIGRTMRGAS